MLRALLMNQQRILLQSWLSAPPFPTLDFSDLRADTQVAGEPLCPFTGHVALLHISLIYSLVMETEVASNSAAGNTAMTILVLVPSGLKEGFP